jgi:hypothetical protein
MRAIRNPDKEPAVNNKYLFMQPLLEKLGESGFFCRLLAYALRATAALIVLFSLVTFFEAGKLIFQLPAQGILGGVLLELFFVLAIYAVVHVFVLRARDIEAIPPTRYYALPAGAVLIRLFGEAYAAFVTLVAVGGGLFVWFTNLKLAKVLNPFIRALFPTLRDDPSFMGGIEFIVNGVLVALVVLVGAYMLAELCLWLAHLANRNGAENRGAATGSQSPEVGQQGGYRSRFGSF